MTASTAAELLLIRHGETAWSRSGQHTSRTDLPLTEVGEAQATALRALVASRSFSLVLSSPRLRARRTAELAGLAAAIIDDDLAEWDYGAYEGRTTAEIAAEVPGWSIWSAPCPGGESAAEVATRVDRVIARVRAQPAGATAVAVAHGHLLRVLAARWIGAEPTDGRWLCLDTATWSLLGWEHAVATVVRWNVPGTAVA